jgi:hypothetical protein
MIGIDAFSNLLWKDDSQGSAILKHPKNFPQFSHLLTVLLEKKSGLLYGCYNSEDQLISACLFGISHRKLYYLAPVNSQEGRDKRGLFGIINTLIQSFSGRPLILDFEGSDIPGLARMYAGFGALETSYSFIRKNQLPWPVSAFKRY